MSPRHPFGNDPAKIARYKTYWDLDSVERPLAGFTQKGWLPIYEFPVSAAWQADRPLSPEMLDPIDFVPHQERLLSAEEGFGDYLIRGACPHQGIPWTCGVIGARLKILPVSVLAEDMGLPLESLGKVDADIGDPWMSAYLRYLDALVASSRGRAPCRRSTELGPSDLAAMLRGHTAMVYDLVDSGEEISEPFERVEDLLIHMIAAAWARLPRWEGGYCDAQFFLRALDPIARLQEDALPLFSPSLYAERLLAVDRRIASRYEYAFMHLHSTSLFVLEELLGIEELRSFELNKDVAGPEVPELVPYIRRLQNAGRSVLFRGEFSADDLRRIRSELDPRGLFVHAMISYRRQLDGPRPCAGL